MGICQNWRLMSDKAGLLGKRMPDHTCIAKEEISAWF
jgi:hypothetical protein